MATYPPLSLSPVPVADRVQAAYLLGQIAAIRDDVAADLVSRFGLGHWAGQTKIDGLKRELKKQKQLYLVHSGDDPVASFAISENGPKFLRASWFTEPDEPVMCLTALAVLSDWQGRGVGRWCMKTIRNNVPQRGFKWMRFDAYDAPAGASKFYLKCGCIQRRKFSFNGVGLIAFEMKCK